MKESKLLKDYPDVLKEWDYDLNVDVLIPDLLFARSNKKFYWKCDKGHPSYLCSVDKKTVRHFGCPVCSNHKIIKGINDFETLHPELMDEWDWDTNNKDNIDPSKLGPISSHMTSWKCKKCGNIWKAPISNRVRVHSGCPYCSNQKVKEGYNDLQTLRPELAKEWDYEKNYPLTPSDIVAFSSKKAWWICNKGHSWQATLDNRKTTGCPYCSNKKVLAGYNDFETTCPDAAKEWDYEKNGNKLPSQFTKGSETKAWWICNKGHSWKTRIAERGKGQSCPYCSNQRILQGYNDLATTNPDLLKEWDYERNKLLPTNIGSGSDKKAWWICSIYGHRWNASIYTRSKGYGCPKCGIQRTTLSRLKKIASNNWIFDKYPDLEKEWDYEKNASVDINLISAGSNQSVWWKCSKGHSFKAIVASRTLQGHGCPYCSKQIVQPGINDLATLNPLLASEWDYTKNAPLTPSQVFPHGGKSVWWKCPVCGYSWKSKINNRANGRGCPNCSKAGTSFIEQSIYYYLKLVFDDAQNRYRYNNQFELDIYIPSIRTAIEYDGSFYHSIKNSKQREKNKDKFCKENGIALIRLREKPLAPTDESINIPCECTNWEQIEQTIYNLFLFLKIKDIPSISLKNDLTKIITSKRKLLKDKAFGIQYPYLLEEWDYERNLPLAPDYFSRGSDVKVWWKCKKCGNVWKAPISSRTAGHGCIRCVRERRHH